MSRHRVAGPELAEKRRGCGVAMDTVQPKLQASSSDHCNVIGFKKRSRHGGPFRRECIFPQGERSGRVHAFGRGCQTARTGLGTLRSHPTHGCASGFRVDWAICDFPFGVLFSGGCKRRVAWSCASQGGQAAANARVQLKAKAGSATWEAKTNAQGAFQFPALPNGDYNLSLNWNGRHAVSADQVILPSTVSAELTISSEGVVTVMRQSASGRAQLSSEKVSELPLNKRDFSQLLLLAAGTMTDSNGATNFTAQFAVNGQRGVEAVFAMDGADISDPEMGGATFSNFNVDAVEEIQSSSGWMPADVGRGAAGFTNILTRSGQERLSRFGV